MLRITARINIGENGGEVDHAFASSGINVSSTMREVIGHYTQIQRPFILGRSRLGGGDCFTKKANFYIGSVVSDGNGNFSSDYDIYVRGENISQLTIVFNKRKNEYPRSIVVDGETFYDDDSTWTLILTNKDTHTIKISNWNTPNSPMVISSIYADLSIELDETNLLDFGRTIMDKSDIEQPSFGIISNTGSLSFIDKDGEVADYIAQQLVNSENVITAYLEDKETGAKEQIAYFNTQNWNYNNSQSLVDVSLKDDLEEWQDINVPAISYVPTVSTSQTAEWFYRYLQEERIVDGKKERITPEKYQMLSFEELDGETQAILRGTTIQYPLLESSNLWNEWNKLCQLCFLYIYKRGDGRTVCTTGV
ncbi:MAG: hypothetical protein NC131_01090 [Roseburia sp.]|nr:hypothetical protein [Roseburia sp.]